MSYASKAEAQAALIKAREKAGKAWQAKHECDNQIDEDAAKAHYSRCVAELEVAINDMGNWEYGEASD